MGKGHRSDHLRIVIQAFKELEVKDYILHNYPEYFKNIRKGSGDWEYVGD